MTAPDGIRMTLDEVRDLARRVLRGVGLDRGHVDAVAETVVAGERDGCTSHGIYRLLVAAHSIAVGVVVPDAVPELSEPARALVRVDGKGGFAQPAFEQGRPLLVDKARANGIAAMAINNVVHFAALWPEVEALAGDGLVAIAVTPGHPFVAPVGGPQPVCGTTPVAFGWPRPGREPFVFDFATGAVARGEIELHRDAGRSVPDDGGHDAAGMPPDEAEAVLDETMRTFGGPKGAALAAMVELLAGPLIGDLSSVESIALDAGRGGSPIGGELILAIDPAGFLGDAVADQLAKAEVMFAAISAQGARLPSDRRYAARRISVEQGVLVPAALHTEILALAKVMPA